MGLYIARVALGLLVVLLGAVLLRPLLFAPDTPPSLVEVLAAAVRLHARDVPGWQVTSPRIDDYQGTYWETIRLNLGTAARGPTAHHEIRVEQTVYIFQAEAAAGTFYTEQLATQEMQGAGGWPAEYQLEFQADDIQMHCRDMAATLGRTCYTRARYGYVVIALSVDIYGDPVVAAGLIRGLLAAMDQKARAALQAQPLPLTTTPVPAR